MYYYGNCICYYEKKAGYTYIHIFVCEYTDTYLCVEIAKMYFKNHVTRESTTKETL